MPRKKTAAQIDAEIADALAGGSRGFNRYRHLPLDEARGNPLHAWGQLHADKLGSYWTFEVDVPLNELAMLRPVLQSKARLTSVTIRCNAKQVIVVASAVVSCATRRRGAGSAIRHVAYVDRLRAAGGRPSRCARGLMLDTPSRPAEPSAWRFAFATSRHPLRPILAGRLTAGRPGGRLGVFGTIAKHESLVRG